MKNLCEEGRSALFYANDQKILEMLLQHRANVDAVDNVQEFFFFFTKETTDRANSTSRITLSLF